MAIEGIILHVVAPHYFILKETWWANSMVVEDMH